MVGETDFRRELAGYEFVSEEQRQQAEKELDAIHYIQQNIDPEQPGMVLEIYRQILDQQLLHTPVGQDFLMSLYDYLVRTPLLEGMEIPAPPQLQSSGEVPLPAKAEPTVKSASGKKTALPIDLPDESLRDKVRQKGIEAQTLRRAQAGEQKLKTRCQWLWFVIVVEFLIIVAMFGISLTSGSTTILNYENKIINKYELWEQELEQREAAVLEREQALGQ
ncbi:MAG: hypothetical protein K2N01_05095 [Lachnospiraceae bacterium]|nr:hypothetical protein [Lachnospiraceae bacterium]